MSDDNRKPLVIRHVDVGALVRPVEQPFVRPRGATPLYPPLSLLPDSDPQDMGDGLALDAVQEVVNYRAPWRRHLASETCPRWGGPAA